MAELELEVASFSELARIVRESCSIADHDDLPDQVRYLESYLGNAELDAKSLVVERPYTDRHYLDEYQGYYATTLHDTRRATTRVHVFSVDLDEEEIERKLVEHLEGGGTAKDFAKDRVQPHYLGFIVLRPLPTVPIGRTVLKTYSDAGPRCYGPSTRPHRVHVFGLTLKAHGIQFHQQDQAAGACATAAVWCALAAVRRRDGGRAATPLAITDGMGPAGRARRVTRGLTLEQMTRAIEDSGYVADVFKPDHDLAGFKLQLMTYLRSGIPVVLQVRDEGAAEGHAITAVGFRLSDETDQDIVWRFGNSRELRSAGMTRLYVHDDRFGPYARMVWTQPDGDGDEDPWDDRLVALEKHCFGDADDEADDNAGSSVDGAENPAALASQPGGLPMLKFAPGVSGFEHFETPMRIWTAMAPLYPKIRFNALNLLEVAGEVTPLARHLAGGGDAALSQQTSFVMSGDYRADLLKVGLSHSRAVHAAKKLLLSRYIGLVRFRVDGEWLVDVVCDVTDILRDSKSPRWGSVIAVVIRDGAAADQIRSQLDSMNPRIAVP